MRHKLLPLAVALTLSCVAPTARAADGIDYQRDIRPILADNCFKCHGPDTEARKGRLRLDLRDAALKGGKSGQAAIVPGKPDAAELIRRINSDVETDLMPPPRSGKKLTDRQKDLLRR